LNTHAQRVLEAIRSELTFQYVRASGPGGQNINKVSTAVQLHFDVRLSPSLDPSVKHRLHQLGGRRMTSRGFLVIEARRHRTQEQNRQEALARFETLILKALVPPKPRHATQPTVGSRERRLRVKKRRSEIKRARGAADLD
jgi:ribosome-associated protein